MSISSLRWRAMLAPGAATAVLLAMAVPAGASTGASTGARQISPQQAGYSATGAHFKAIGDHVYLRNPAQYRGEVASLGHSAQLWSANVVVTVGVMASTSGKSYTNYATIYDRSTRQVIASNPNAKWCAYPDCYPGKIGSWGAGSEVRLTIKYFPATGELNMLVGDLYGKDFFYSTYTLTSQSFTQARVGTDFGSSPWDASYSYTPPARSVKVASYNDVSLTTYNGHTTTLESWWAHHKLRAKPPGGSVAVPHDLYNGGASFQTWFAPRLAADPGSVRR